MKLTINIGNMILAIVLVGVYLGFMSHLDTIAEAVASCNAR